MTVVTIQQRRATSTEWSTKNPILKAGEIGFEIDTGKIKCGNGITPWNELVYISGDVNAVQNTGQSTTQVMSQKAVTDELEGKVDKEVGKGLIEPAPVDGKEYARKDGAWVEVVGGGGGGDVEEAPLDGELYLRGNGTWNKYAAEKILYVDFPLENGVQHKFTEADFTDTTAVYKGTAQYSEFIFVPYTASFLPDFYAWIVEFVVGGVAYKVLLVEGEAVLVSSPVTYTVDSQYRPAGVNRIRYDGYFDQLLGELSMKVLFEVDSSYVADTVLETFDIPKEPFLSGATELESFFSNLDKSEAPDVVSATYSHTANGFSAGKLYWEINFVSTFDGQADYMKISYSSERSGSQTHEFSVTV